MTDISYKDWSSMSDRALSAYIGAFIKHHRLELNIKQEELAREAGIGRSTLSQLERGETVTLATLIQVLRMLDQLNVLNVFAVEQSISPLTLARIEKKKRKRARGETHESKNETEW